MIKTVFDVGRDNRVNCAIEIQIWNNVGTIGETEDKERGQYLLYELQDTRTAESESCERFSTCYTIRGDATSNGMCMRNVRYANFSAIQPDDDSSANIMMREMIG